MAIRILQDLELNKDDLGIFLRATHLDALFEALGQLCRSAGHQSALTNATNLLWAGELGAILDHRLSGEREAIRYATAFLSANSNQHHSIKTIIEQWETHLQQKRYVQALQCHEALHAQFLTLSVAGYTGQCRLDDVLDFAGEVQRYSAQVKQLIDLNHRVAHAYRIITARSPFTTSEAQGDNAVPEYSAGQSRRKYDPDEEHRMLTLHKRIADAVLSGDTDAAIRLIERHFEWRAPANI